MNHPTMNRPTLPPLLPARLPCSQRGLGMVGLTFVFGCIALVAILVIKCLPLYLNQMKVAKALHGVADDPELSASDAQTIRDRLHRRWLIDSIDSITPEDIKVKRGDGTRAMIYDYEARAHLFYNIDLVVHFKDEVALRPATSGN